MKQTVKENREPVKSAITKSVFLICLTKSRTLLLYTYEFATNFISSRIEKDDKYRIIFQSTVKGCFV